MSEREKPLVVVVCAVPLLGEALCDALEGVAECTVVPAREPDLGGLLRSLQPDAIVCDDEEQAESSAAYARFARIPVVHVSLRTHRLRVLDENRWHSVDDLEATPEGVRNLVAAEIYGRGALR